MFRVDFTTRTTSFVTKLASSDYEDFVALQVLGRAPVWYVAVTNVESEGAASAPRRFMFTDILQALFVVLSEGWIDRELFIITSDDDRRRVDLALERVEQVWDCSSSPANLRFEVITSTRKRFITARGEPLRRSRRRHLLWPPTHATAST